MNTLTPKRELLKANFISLKDYETDQVKGLPMPPIEKELTENESLLDLPKLDTGITKNDSVGKCLQERRSRRTLDKGTMSIPELSYLLYMTQGVQRVFTRSEHYQVTLRTAPSAGARHPFETYLLVKNVEGLEPGVYRYQPLEHKLAYLQDVKYTTDQLVAGVNGQEFVGNANVVFVWTAVPYKTEWRYAGESAKIILLDAGHVCQNLYIAAEALCLGTCGVAAYHQQKMDSIVNVDGSNEMVVYLAPVGTI